MGVHGEKQSHEKDDMGARTLDHTAYSFCNQGLTFLGRGVCISLSPTVFLSSEATEILV